MPGHGLELDSFELLMLVVKPVQRISIQGWVQTRVNFVSFAATL